MDATRLEVVYAQQLIDLYSLEAALGRAWPRLARRLCDAALERLLLRDGQETTRHLQRLESMLLDVQRAPARRHGQGMVGMLVEVLRRSRTHGDPAVRDAEIVCLLQRMKYYEIGAYNCARMYARRLAYPEAAELLQASMAEEQAISQILSEVAGTWMPSAA